MIIFENRIVIFILLFFAVLSGWGFYLLQSSNSKEKNYGHYPDSIGVNLRMLRYDQTGFLLEISTAQKATHYPDSKTTLFDDIHIQVFNHENNPPWLISAPSGIAYGKGEKLEALGPVHMQQAAYESHGESQLDTQNVTIFTDQKYLTTAAPVTATQPGIQVYGVGAKYDYDKNILNLFDQVKVNYQPTKK